MNFDEAKDKLLSAAPIKHDMPAAITEFPCVSACWAFKDKVPFVEPVPKQKIITEPIPFLDAMKFLGVKIMYESSHELERDKTSGYVPWARYVRKNVAHFGGTIYLRVRNSPATIIHELVHVVQEHLNTHDPVWDMLTGVDNHEFQAWFLECAITDDDESFETMKYICQGVPLDRLTRIIDDNKNVIMSIWNFLEQFGY